VRYLTLAEVAAEMRFSVKTAPRRVHSGDIPAMREGGRWLVSDAEMRRHVERLGAPGLGLGAVHRSTPRPQEPGSRLWD
jgi:excisionase family DNA binding protein